MEPEIPEKNKALQNVSFFILKPQFSGGLKDETTKWNESKKFYLFTFTYTQKNKVKGWGRGMGEIMPSMFHRVAKCTTEEHSFTTPSKRTNPPFDRKVIQEKKVPLAICPCSCFIFCLRFEFFKVRK